MDDGCREQVFEGLADELLVAMYYTPNEAKIARGVDANCCCRGVAVVGSIEELGNWDVQKALHMTTNESLYPQWEGEIIIQNGQQIEYKYIKCM